MPAKRLRLLSIAVPGEPPTEFRIFSAGRVETTKGVFTFDDRAIASVLEAHARQGNELMVDYDHASVSTTMADPAMASRAAGWFDLEVRNGELWAVNVRWTPPAEQALRNREWRYMSPAFNADEDGRIVELINVALTNLPATHNLTPLVAANTGEQMSPEQFAAIAEALGLGADANIEDVLATIAAMVAKVKDATSAVESAPAEEAPAEPMPEEAMADAPAAEEEDKQVEASVAASLCRLSNRTTVVAALEEIEQWRKAYVELSAAQAKLADERAVLEAHERRNLVAELVKCGAEIPATAWGDEKGSKPCKRLADEPLSELRERVAKLKAARVEAPRGNARPSTLGLTESELAACKAMNCSPETFAALKAQRAAKRI